MTYERSLLFWNYHIFSCSAATTHMVFEEPKQSSILLI